MPSVLDRVRRFVRQHDLARSGTRVVVALSGGSDSVALAYLLRDLDAAGELQVAGVAHFNHQLRETADRDERFCRSLAGRLGWSILVDRREVAARARREGRSLEVAARSARLEFLECARSQFEADVVAVGHTRDDQAETFLLRLLRGAGPKGLAAMHPRNAAIIRPLLACRRSALRTFLEAAGIEYMNDETNADVSIPRNRIRAELLPLLERRFNPSIVDVLADQAEMARDEWTWMLAEVGRCDEVARSAGNEGLPVIELDVARLRAAPLALRRLLVWRAMLRVSGGRPVGFSHVEHALGLTSRNERAAIDGPGQRVERMASRLVLTGRPPGAAGRRVARAVNLFRYPLSIPGEVRLADLGCVVSAAPGRPDRDTAFDAIVRRGSADAVAAIRGDLCGGSWAIRNRRPGDRFRPVGVGGRKKLQDYFVDLKVPREKRDEVPLVVDENDRIVWVAGYGIDEAFRVTDPSQAVLILKLRQVGRPA